MDSEAAGPRRWRLGSAALWVAVVFAAAYIGTRAALPGAWYAALDKPAWNPPNWLFGPVWTTLYLLMALAASAAWDARSKGTHHLAFWLFGLQLMLNALWSWLFFHGKRPDLALVALVLLWLLILATTVSFYRIRRLAGWLLAPYLAWVGFAGVLNASLVARNPGGVPAISGPVTAGIATDDCAPWDGRATTIYLSAANGSDAVPPAPPYLQITLYESRAELAGGRVRLGQLAAGSGIAVRCTGERNCTSSSTGEVTIDQAPPEGALTGSYRVELNGETLTGRFRALWRPRSILCG